MPLVQLADELIGTLEQGTREWKKNLGEVTEAQIVWQPIDGMHSIGGVILHTMAWQSWWCEVFIAGGVMEPFECEQLRLEKYLNFSGACPPPPREPLDWYYDLLRLNRSRCLMVFDRLAPDTKIEREGTRRSVRWVLNYLVDHDSYHGGQAVLLKSLFEAKFGG